LEKGPSKKEEPPTVSTLAGGGGQREKIQRKKERRYSFNPGERQGEKSLSTGGRKQTGSLFSRGKEGYCRSEVEPEGRRGSRRVAPRGRRKREKKASLLLPLRKGGKKRGSEEKGVENLLLNSRKKKDCLFTPTRETGKMCRSPY